ncbi:hypothetical protein EXIGLDRAFT_772794 [Exidia glandulosa HHB12029]|uniref:F-box domain-containing protein n=1 Tax=Exidia glandulosa HHB12029 TaxID=1314781 RepID=A0A165F433_EXIGL|nr:hypothetical protein EXIGLDRAFT_772794 [Exidia glandulosa HHB12029]
MSSGSAQVTALAVHIECLLGQHAESLSPADVYLAVRQGCGRFLAQRNARCPAARLPHDILAIIFVSLEQDERLTASAVCQQWRAAALNDARIWSDIGIFVDCDPLQYNDDLMMELEAHCCPWDYPRVANTSNYRLLPLLLERSKEVPVTLDLFFSAHSQTGIQDRILAHLTAHAAHIKSLYISTEGCHRWHRILAFLPQKMPLLTRLSLNRPDSYDSGMAVSDFGMRARDRWSRYPSLEVLEFHGVCDLLTQDSTKPSPSITSITLRNVDITYSLLCELFKFFPSLRTLQIEVQSINIDTWWDSDAFVAIPHRLDCLRITEWTSSVQYSALMSALQADQIRKLSVRPAYTDDHIARVFSHLASIGTLSLQVDSDGRYETLIAVDVDGRERQATSRRDGEKLLRLAEALDLQRLTELKLSCHAWKQLETLRPTSCVLPALQTLSVIFIAKKTYEAGFFDPFPDPAKYEDADLCDTHAVKLLSCPLECPALRLLSFTTWQYGPPCKVIVSILTTVVRSLAAPKLDVRVQGILLVGDRDETATTDQQMQQLKELTRSLTYGRRSI